MDSFLKNCTGVILAGGENTRMPVSKAFIEVGGTKIIERNAGIMKSIFHKVFIVTNEPESYAYLGVPMLGDVYNTRGPMTGIFTALLNSTEPWVFISACDMPFISGDLIRYMSSGRKNSLAVVPVLHDKTEPLFAFYSKKLRPSMEKAIMSGRKSLRDFLAGKRVQYITTDEVKRMDPGAASLVNLNTPGDIDLHLQAKDRIRFRRTLGRRGKCSV